MKSTDDSFFADAPELPKTGRESAVLVSYNDALAVPADALSEVSGGDDRYRPAITCVMLLLQVMQHDRDFPRLFVRRLHTVFALAGSSYVQEILLLALAGQPLPGPLELGERYGITKQAVSREILDAIARIRAEEPRLADLLEAARVFYHADDPMGARAPRPRETEYPVQASMCDGHTVIEVDFGAGGRREATVKRDGEFLVFESKAFGAAARHRRDKCKLIVVETDRGTVVSVPFIRAA